MDWSPCSSKKYGIAVACFNKNGIHRLSFKLGDRICILEECQDWCRGFVEGNESIRGIFPIKFVILLKDIKERVNLQEADPLATEMTSVLREWGDIWKRLFMEGKSFECSSLRKAMEDLINWRKQLIHDTLTVEQLHDVRNRIISKINWGNRKLGLDFVPRVGEKVVGSSSVGIFHLYQVHLTASEPIIEADTVDGPKKEPSSSPLTNLLLMTAVRHFGLTIGEDIEMYLQLYDITLGKYISERFLVKISKDVSFSSYLDGQSTCSAVFTDICKQDNLRDLYLVIYVIRCGRIVYTDSCKKPPQYVYRRPYGCAVTSLQDAYAGFESIDGDGKELILRLYQCDDRDFSQLHEYLIRKQNSKFSPLSSSNSQGIVLQLNFISCNNSSPSMDQQLFLSKSVLVRKLGFPDIIMPGDVRNDIYVHLIRGEFDRGGKTAGRNIEVDIKLISGDGQLLKDSISHAVGYVCASFSSLTLHHICAPIWNEMIKLNVPICMIPGIHLRFDFKYCSSKEKYEPKLFGFSFLRLIDDEGTVIQDGNHELIVYRADDPEKLVSASYASLPSTPHELHKGEHSEYANLSCLGFTRSVKEWIVVEFQLCSTKLTQNSDLLALLKWKSYPDRILEILRLVSRLRGEEVVKFLQDVLDALFAMFSTEEGFSTPHSGAVFVVLINVLNLLEDSRFVHFKPVVDAYIKNHFSAALAYNGLVDCLKRHTTFLPNPERQPQLIKCFRSFDFLSRFIVQSWKLHSRASPSDGGQQQTLIITDLFDAFRLMMDTTYDIETSHDAKVIFLKVMPAAISNFLEVLDPESLAGGISELIDSLGATESAEEIIAAKLHLIKRIVATTIFSQPSSRCVALPVLSHHIRLHLAARQDLSQCAAVLGDILDYFYKNRTASVEGKVDNIFYHDVEVLTVSLVDVLVQTTLSAIDSFDPNVGSLEACFLGLLQLLSECHYDRFWEDFGDRRLLKSFLFRFLTLINHIIINREVFPSDWFVIRLAANVVLLRATKECSKPLIDSFLDAGYFEPQLWNLYLCLNVTFITQPSLQVEGFGESRKKMLGNAGLDMRIQLGSHLIFCWSTLGDYQASFIPGLVSQFLEVTLIPEADLRTRILGVFFDMMECEQKVHGNFKQVEYELVEKLDFLVNENKGDQQYKELFNTILMEKARNCDLSWRENCLSFVTSLTRLLERLLDYRMVLYGDENLNKQMSCTYNLLNFYKDEIDRQDMYVRYVYKLHGLHVTAENNIEAGMTLFLYAKMLLWSNSVLPSNGKRPEEPEWKRKEELYLQIIDYFDKGKAWEKGIQLCEELTEFYKQRANNTIKIPVTLRMQATFYEKMLEEHRPETEFFFVGFYGCDFPPFVRNKKFVYRGLEYERISAFTQRLMSEYPSTQLLTKMGPPPEAILKSNQQYLQICNVKPVVDEAVSQLGNKHEKLRNYHYMQNVRQFILDRPIRKGNANKENEFQNLWVERTILKIAHSLPGVLRWFEVVDSAIDELPPIQAACEAVLHASEELERLIAVYSSGCDSSISPLTMRLQGMIDAAVMGGLAKYQEAFLTSEFRMNNPQFLDKVSYLKQLIADQFRLLDVGLALHSRLVPHEVQPLHNRLVECFAKTKLTMKDVGIAVVSGGGHRRADSDAGIEYRLLGTFNEKPLPPRTNDHRRPTRSATVSLHPYSSQSTSLHETFTDAHDDIYTLPNDEESYPHMSQSSSWFQESQSSSQTRSPARQNASDYVMFSPIHLKNQQEAETVSLTDSGIVSLNGEDRTRSFRSSVDTTRLTPEPVSNTPPPLPPRSAKDEEDVIRGPSPNLPRLYPKRSYRKVITPAINNTCHVSERHPFGPPPLPPKTQMCIPSKNNLGRRFEYDTVTSITGADSQETQSSEKVHH
ncbi:dedicator of cytokinesis protein 3-like isoform X2 [Artemia franciscana]|uniref:Dedicator of cytokinesis protein 3 n=2 Tax=Artemia franciscana TaxID=6661 RepID=A0AA88LFU7_ARTSF|nr:hypothetical protein QYM36_003188 [Artemia franciscana]